MTTKCKTCGVGKENMSRCSKCHIVSYCSRECQMKDWHKSHKKQCKKLENNEQKDDVMSILSFPEELHNQKYSPYSCATCGSNENLKKCDRCQLVAYCSKYCENKNWYNHKHGCEQNQEVVGVIETKGYKQLVRETQSRRLQSPYNPGFDLPNSESRERYGSYPMQRSNDVGLSISNVNSISLLFDLGFLLISFLFLLIFIFGSILFLLFCFCLCVFSSFEQEARMNFSDQNWSAVGRRHRRLRRRHR